MITPNVRLRNQRIEDNPAPSRSSSYFSRHFRCFELEPNGKTIKTLVLELKLKVREAFIRNCHLQPETYNFSEFKNSRQYRLQRELLLYLSQLSSWLYRETKFPPTLKKAFSKMTSFRNPYENFSLTTRAKDLSAIDDLRLTLMYNLDICSSSPSTKFRARILQEFFQRGMDISSVDPEERVLVENLSRNRKSLISPLKNDLKTALQTPKVKF